MQAHEFMTKDPVTVSPDTPMPEIARLLLAHRISAAPVVDAEGVPIGMVSEGDLLGRGEADREARRDWWLMLLAEGEALHPDSSAVLRSWQRADAENLSDSSRRSRIAVGGAADDACEPRPRSQVRNGLSAGGRWIRTSGTADDARLLADLYAHSASRQMPQKGVRIREVRMQRFSFCQQHQPPITPRFAISIAAPQQVALADHADRSPGVIQNRRSANLVTKKKPRNLRRWGIGRDGNRLLGHKFVRLHQEILVVRSRN
jgi:hypothetical protein